MIQAGDTTTGSQGMKLGRRTFLQGLLAGAATLVVPPTPTFATPAIIKPDHLGSDAIEAIPTPKQEPRLYIPGWSKDATATTAPFTPLAPQEIARYLDDLPGTSGVIDGVWDDQASIYRLESTPVRAYLYGPPGGWAASLMTQNEREILRFLGDRDD